MQQDRERAPTRIRFPEALKQRIQKEAANAGRTMNSEVVIGMTKRYEAKDKARAQRTKRAA